MNYDSKNMKFYEKGGVAYLTFLEFEKYGFVRHAFSTRIGGVSKKEFASMNLNFGRGDSDEDVTENFHRFCSAAGFDYTTLVASAQDHGTFIRRVGARNRGTGIWKPKDIQSVDGLITDEADVTLVTFYADCVPLFFLDPARRAIGLAHAGWRGTVAGIGAKMVKAMGREFGSSPRDLVAAVGPSIGPECFEVDTPVYEEFSKLTELNPQEFIVNNGGGKYHIDLWEANRRILMHAGIPQEQISVAGLCTRCNAQWLWSHRATGGKRGGLAAMMCLTEGRA
ncbi:peptidoglycan editing factor PgeF [Caproiciproducens galactitolivorans]|uniref:Purine nucleoside phosphorylase n=1 Tax=Caproiciproducens galactitolivorans TaxID=642589 RepID=A0A4Z0Y485_9FIRM|nr:peptidoglycan editing factor PgeF [Caproiciproducens galactitolivorans]QEY34527.1 peptidoglycan editing factor PgeF [Caproiciproducens galactitolivorans]TGJ77687.1 laccase domain protein [Caproiciproducens galactitolivorans]